MTEREACGSCCGTGVNGHPDSGYTCYECNGKGGVMSDPDELKSCPFCGGGAEIVVFRHESYGYFCEMRGVKCKNCWCKTQGFETEAYEVGRGMYAIDADGPAIAAWNRRAEG